VERFCDGLKQEPRMILIAMQFSVCAGIGKGRSRYRKGTKSCSAWLAHVRELEKGSIDLASIPVVREFRHVFPEELPGLPLVEKLKFP
jgi:hypothetical protein